VGEGEPAARLALADHVVACATCAADFRLLRELHEEASRERRRPSRWVWMAAGAAAGLALVAVAPLLLREPPEAVRGVLAEARPADGAVVEAAPERLAWPSEPGARGYRVKLFRGDGEAAWESATVSDTAVALPGDVRSAMGPGTSWYWKVEALGPVHRRHMGPFWFQVRAP
jgi:hypothetical protein